MFNSIIGLVYDDLVFHGCGGFVAANIQKCYAKSWHYLAFFITIFELNAYIASIPPEVQVAAKCNGCRRQAKQERFRDSLRLHI